MVKALIKKLANMFCKHPQYLVAGLVVLAMAGVFGGSYALGMRRSNSAAGFYEEDIQKEIMTEKADDAGEDNLYIDTQNGQAYLYTGTGEILFGPCRYIYDDISFWQPIFRFVDNNGLIGYAKKEGNKISILHEGKFFEASKMQDGSACVKEKGNYYYIDTEGKQFTYGDYIEAYPFAESQGSFARVKTKAGKWSIIDRDENVIFEDFDSINELPYFSAVGSAVKDGKVVLFSLEYTDHMQSSVVCTLDEYTEISMEHSYDDCAIVTDKAGNKGVIIVRNGEVLIPAEYVRIETGYMPYREGGKLKQRWFSCQKKDGTREYIYYDEPEY